MKKIFSRRTKNENDLISRRATIQSNLTRYCPIFLSKNTRKELNFMLRVARTFLNDLDTYRPVTIFIVSVLVPILHKLSCCFPFKKKTFRVIIFDIIGVATSE